jgi:hypothetical protein
VEEAVEVDKPVPDTGDDTGREDGAELFLGDTEYDTVTGNKRDGRGDKRLHTTD